MVAADPAWAEGGRAVCWMPAVAAVQALADAAPACGCAGRSHLVVGYNDYTYFHLPKGDAPKNTEAMPAIFAARIARSSL